MSVIAMEVTSAEKHPNADSLRVYDFVAPSRSKIRVVANLSHVYEVGDVVAVALLGAKLRDGTTIRKARLRGVESSGMALGKVGVAVGTDLSEKHCMSEEEMAATPPQMIKWTSLEQLHHIRNTTKLTRERLGEEFEFPTVDYRAKVKLDGTNAGVQLVPGHGVVAQSRSRMITPDDDNMGFASWVHKHRTYFETLMESLGHAVIYGEWCGTGIQKRTAITKIERKVFAVFAIQYGDHNEGHTMLDIEPARIRALLPEHPEIFVLPWYGESKTLSFVPEEQDTLRKRVEEINQMVLEVEEVDPWVQKTFGVQGIGEGLVFYPVTPEVAKGPVPRGECTWLMFKAKGEKHQVVKQKKPVQLDPEVAKNVADFVDMFLTEARLEQGIREGCGGESSMKKMGDFLRWIGQDVKKEGQVELEASGLKWKQVGKSIGNRAREWYKAKVETI